MALTLSPFAFLARATVSTSSSTTDGRPPVRPCRTPVREPSRVVLLCAYRSLWIAVTLRMRSVKSRGKTSTARPSGTMTRPPSRESRKRPSVDVHRWLLVVVHSDRGAEEPTTGVIPNPPARVGARRQSPDRPGTRHAPRSRAITHLRAQLRADSPASRERGAQRLRLRQTAWLSGSVGTPRLMDHRRGRSGVASRALCSRLPEDRPG